MLNQQVASLKDSALKIIHRYQNEINPPKLPTESSFHFFSKHFSLGGGSMWKGQKGRDTAQRFSLWIEAFNGNEIEFVQGLFAQMRVENKKTIIGSRLISQLLDFVGQSISQPRLTHERIERGLIMPIFIATPESDRDFFKRLQKVFTPTHAPLVANR